MLNTDRFRAERFVLGTQRKKQQLVTGYQLPVAGKTGNQLLRLLVFALSLKRSALSVLIIISLAFKIAIHGAAGNGQSA